jgi:hypothetical protein
MPASPTVLLAPKARKSRLIPKFTVILFTEGVGWILLSVGHQRMALGVESAGLDLALDGLIVVPELGTIQLLLGTGWFKLGGVLLSSF